MNTVEMGGRPFSDGKGNKEGQEMVSSTVLAHVTTLL